METFASRMIKAMAWAGKNQSELARAAGVRQQSINAIVLGETKKSRFVVELAKACGVQTDWLGQGTGDMLVAHGQGSLLSAEEERLIDVFRHLGPPARQAVLAVAESFRAQPASTAPPFRRGRRA